MRVGASFETSERRDKSPRASRVRVIVATGGILPGLFLLGDFPAGGDGFIAPGGWRPGPANRNTDMPRSDGNFLFV